MSCDHKFVDSNRCLKCGWSPDEDKTNKAIPVIVDLGQCCKCGAYAVVRNHCMKCGVKQTS